LVLCSSPDDPVVPASSSTADPNGNDTRSHHMRTSSSTGSLSSAEGETVAAGEEPGRSVAAAILGRCSALMGVVAAEVSLQRDCLDSKWTPVLPMLQGDDARELRSGSMLSWLLGGGNEIGKVRGLCTELQKVLQKQPVVSEVEAPAKVFGDVHGQLRDLLLLFHFYGTPGQEEATDDVPISYVFNGDWVDRGAHQLEVVVLLFALKIFYPDLVWLNRGNHEDSKQNAKTSQAGGRGFDRSCMEEYGLEPGMEIFHRIHRVFDWLPLAARIDERVLVIHGGLGCGRWTLDELNELQRPVCSDDLVSTMNGDVYNILWSDPVQHTADNLRAPQKSFGVHKSHRAKHTDVMKVFGRDVTERFCRAEKLWLVIRSHQFKNPCKGYEVMHDGWLVRVFSARNYCGKVPNDGAVLLIGRAENAREKLLVRPQTIERLNRKTSLKISDVMAEEPYCPNGHLMQLVKPKVAKCSFHWHGAHEDENTECNRCGAEELDKTCYFNCRGCGTKADVSYNLCLDCAGDLTTGGPTLLGGLDTDNDESDQSDHEPGTLRPSELWG